MCGIFGLVRNIDAAHPERASAVFVELGRLAVARGSDSSGFAVVDWTPATGKVRPATAAQARAENTTIGGTTIIKAAKSFQDLWDDTTHLPVLTPAAVAIGHTRWATQGAKTAVNASPMAVGSLVGTHNGDVDTETIPGHAALAKAAIGSTDSEVLYRAINDERSHRARITELLSAVEGRAALAWIDRSQANRVYLARAALSPLAIAWDAEGNFYWASVPEWFRLIETQFDGAIGFHDITIVREGTLLTVDHSSGAPVVQDQRSFTPVARRSDTWLSDAIVWRGFSDLDKASDKAQKAHTVSTRPSKSIYSGYGSHTPTTTTTTVERAYGAGKASMSGYDSWDQVEPDPTMAADLYDDEDNEDMGDDDFCEEAEEAAMMWAEDDYNQAVTDVCLAADTRDEAQMEALASDYGFSTTAVARAFVREILGWVEQLEVEARAEETDTETADEELEGTGPIAPMKSLLAAPVAGSEYDGPLTRVDLAPARAKVNA